MSVRMILRRHHSRKSAVIISCMLAAQGLLPQQVSAHDYSIPNAGVSPGAPGNPKGGQEATQNPGTTCPPDPVDLSRGDFILCRHDVVLPGRGLSVDIEFTYRSRSAQFGAFGNGWDMSYNRRIQKLENNNLVLMRGHNRQDEFTYSAPSTYTAPSGIYSTLVQNGNGTYTLTTKHGQKEYYDVNGNLTSIEDRNGNALTFSYSAQRKAVTAKTAYVINSQPIPIARIYQLSQITDTTGRTISFSYHATTGHLTSISYLGRTIAYTYDTNGDLLTVTSPPTSEFPSGSTTTYTYSGHNLLTVTTPKGHTYVSNTYNSDDRITSQVHGPGTATLAYTTSLTCPSVPASGNPGYALSLTPQTASPGNQLTVVWSSPSGSVFDRIGLFRRYAQDVSPSAFVGTAGATSGTNNFSTTSFPQDQYEARYLVGSGGVYTAAARSNTMCLGTTPLVAGQVTRTDFTDYRGVETRYDFDAAGHITRKEIFTDETPSGEPASYVTTYEYNAGGERTRAVYPRGNAIEFAYDAKGNVTEARRKKIGMTAFTPDATDIVTTLTYESTYNFVKTITDPLGNVTTYTYDYELSEPNKGNLRKITRPSVGGLTIETVFTYNSYGQIETITDPTAIVTKYVYDGSTGYLLQITRAFGTGLAGTTTFTYDTAGNVTSVTDPRSNTTNFTYNVVNQLLDVTAPSSFNFKTHYVYDANGNVIHIDRQAVTGTPGSRPTAGTVSSTDDWQSTVYTYTNINQLATVKDDLGNVTTFAYNNNGDVASLTDAKSQVTSFAYDERNLLWKITDAAGTPGITEYLYNGNGYLASIKDPSTNISTYTRDDFDRPTRLTYPGGAYEDFAYDKASNLTSKINARTQTISFTYDALHRLTQKATPADTFTYTYDKANRLLTAVNATGTVTNTYDGRGRLSTVTFPGSHVLTYGYDVASNRISVAYPASGPTPTFTYDNLNRPTNLTDLNAQNVTFAYDALSRRATMGLPNGVTSTYGYDTVNRLTSLTHANGGGTLSSFTYGYDNIGNRTSITDPQGSHTLTYDPLSQLTAITNPAISYAYDATGNRTTAGGVSYTSNTRNQYTAVGAATHTHDNDGNLTGDGTSTYTWDAEHLLTQAAKGGTTVTFTYDALGRRASKTVGGTTTKFLYDGPDLIAETNNAGTITATYLFGPRIDEPLERKASSTTVYYNADGLRSVAHLTNGSAALIEQYHYDAYGAPTLRDGTGAGIGATAYGNNFLFTGREWESSLELYYYRARYYSNALGRFLNRDPLSYRPDINLYRYVGNNPRNWIDPWGLWSPATMTIGPIGPSSGPQGFPISGPNGPPSGFTVGEGPILPQGDPTPEPTPGIIIDFPTPGLPQGPGIIDVTPEPGSEIPGDRTPEGCGGRGPGVETADAGDGEESDPEEEKQKQNPPKQPREGELRWDPKTGRWVDDSGVFTYDPRPHRKRGGDAHHDFGSWDGNIQLWSPDGGITWYFD